jgi:heptosyltransferase-1
MKVLLVKMSSLGDVIHTLPALSDARAAHPGLAFDWVVEEAFREVPAWHPAVARVIPIALRRWRRAPLAACRSGEWAGLRRALSAARYDLVLDAQGLLKSAFVTRLVPGPRAGYDRRSVREAPAALAYERRIAVPRALHAIERSRRLFAVALDYEVPDGGPDYGLDAGRLAAAAEAPARDAVLFLHGSSRPEKCWPEAHWIALGARAAEAGLHVLLPWGSAAERERAGRIAQALPHARVLPRLALADLASLMRAARAVVAVDTGLGHLAAALGRPCVSLYGPTRTALIGAMGPGQRHVCAPGGAMDAIAPESVWPALAAALEPS